MTDVTDRVLRAIEYHTRGKQSATMAEHSLEVTLCVHADEYHAEVRDALDELEASGRVEREDGRIRLLDG